MAEVSDIEVTGRHLEIVRDGRVIQSPIPKDFDPTTFRHIVAGIDYLYRVHGVVPAIETVVDRWDGYTKDDVERAWVTPELKQALEIRGINLIPRKSLTAEQGYALQILQDPTDRRSTKTKLEQIGVSMAKYRAWMRNPIFSSAMNEAAEFNLGDSVQMALNRLIANAESGDNQAINKILEVSGRWNPQQQEAQNARTVVMLVMEVIQEELADDKPLLNKILDRVRGRVAALSIEKSITP